MKTCLELFDGPDKFGIRVEQSADLTFRVTYGMRVCAGLTYAEASKNLGECILHYLACEGKLDNNGP